MRIRPGQWDSEIRVDLISVDLANAPCFQALSYVWGSNDDSVSPYIQVNGHNFAVRPNLFNAIRRLRSADFGQLVWVDAICIDQRNLSERNHQVTIMWDIYGAASDVVVYLGESTARTEEAMHALQYFLKEATNNDEAPWSYTALPDIEMALSDILTRPWFERIWTVQEVALARHTTLVCGPHSISWSADYRTTKAIVFRIKAAAVSPYFCVQSGYISKLDWDPLLHSLEVQMRQAARREGVTIHRNQLDLAYDFRHRKSSDPRDRYFAIFNIIENDQGGKLELSPDYSISLEELQDRFLAEVQRLSRETLNIGQHDEAGSTCSTTDQTINNDPTA